MGRFQRFENGNHGLSNRAAQRAIALLDLGEAPGQALLRAWRNEPKMNIIESSATDMLPALVQPLHRFWHHLDEHRYASMPGLSPTNQPN